MQTFLAYPEFDRSASVLDNRRLNKQRIECMQIYNVLKKISEGDSGRVAWRNHPAVLQWVGYDDHLLAYWQCVETECRNRCFKPRDVPSHTAVFDDPWWLGLPEYHLSHRLNLVYKNPAWYLPKFPDVLRVPFVKPDYWWPSQHDAELR